MSRTVVITGASSGIGRATAHLFAATGASLVLATVDSPFFSHAASYSKRALLALPSVYPPKKIAATIVRVSAQPKAEVAVWLAGKAFVREHRRHPNAVETHMAVQTNALQLSPTEDVPVTSGNLFEPSSGSGIISSGKGGTRKHTARKAAFASFVAVAESAALFSTRNKVVR